MRRRTAAGLADTDTDARERQLPYVVCHTAEHGHAAPDRDGPGKQVASIEAFREAGDRNAERYVEKRECRAREQTQNRVRRLELNA